MHSDPAEIQKSVAAYIKVGLALFVFTGITVAVNIASFKGSMVASVFMHLSHEKRWIYGSLLLTVAFFIVLLFVPLFTTMDTIGSPNPGQTQTVMHDHMEH